MVQIITPARFAAAFEATVGKRQKDIASSWKPWNAREYTSLFLNREDAILREVAGNLGLRYKSPWWTLDAIFFEEEDRVHFPKWTMAKYLSVAIEHENYSVRSAYQVNKLSIFNAPLKVLIIYPGRPGRRGEPEVRNLLDLCADVAKSGDALDDFSHLRRQMVVLGSDHPIGADGDGRLHWRYFVYEHGKFVELTQ